jgi:hypothetical protein
MTTGYEIPFEKAETVKNLVGKTLITPDGRNLNITRWEGQNLTITDPVTGKEGVYPAVVILDRINRKQFTVK